MTDLTKILEDLQMEALKATLERIKSGEASAAELRVALDILKHNGISVTSKAAPQLDEIRRGLEGLGEEPLPFPKEA